MEWQPIETAPKDGIDIIGAYHSADGTLRRLSLMRWMTAQEIADWEDGNPEDYAPGWDENGEEVCATHWMPLPPPPQ